MSETAKTRALDAWPEVTRFYGITPLELQHLPHALVQHYVDQMPRLRALEQLASMNASAYPHLEPKAQSRMLDRMLRLAGIEQEVEQMEDPRASEGSREEAEQRLRALGLGLMIDKGAERAESDA